VSGFILALWLVSLVSGGLRARRVRQLDSASFRHGVAGSSLMLSGMAAMTMMASMM
jgi:hypothetical protein